MTAEALSEQTYLPESAEQLAGVYDFLSAYQDRRGNLPSRRYMLAGADTHAQVEVPEEVHRILMQVVEALRAGRAVTIAPHSMTLTTQQAADILNVSRPTVVRLLDSGKMPFERTGTHRKLRLRDVLDYRERRAQAQYDALLATSVDIDENEDPQQVLDQLREARRAVAARRRSG